MPTYDYVCRECGKLETRLVPITERDYQVCCFRQMKRKPSAPAFALKGSGFYANDYRKKETA